MSGPIVFDLKKAGGVTVHPRRDVIINGTCFHFNVNVKITCDGKSGEVYIGPVEEKKEPAAVTNAVAVPTVVPTVATVKNAADKFINNEKYLTERLTEYGRLDAKPFYRFKTTGEKFYSPSSRKPGHIETATCDVAVPDWSLPNCPKGLRIISLVAHLYTKH